MELRLVKENYAVFRIPEDKVEYNIQHFAFSGAQLANRERLTTFSIE